MTIDSKMFSCLFIQFFWIDWFAVFDDDMYFFTRGKCASKMSAVLFMLIGMIAHPVFSAILSAPSRNGSIESSSPLLRVPSGKMQMEMPFLHNQLPEGSSSDLLSYCLCQGRDSTDASSMWKEAESFPFLFGNITGQTPAPAVSKENIKITAVVADKEYRFIRNIFFTDHGCRDTGHLKNHFKAPLNDAQRTDIFGSAIEFTNDPLHQKNRNGQDQVKN